MAVLPDGRRTPDDELEKPSALMDTLETATMDLPDDFELKEKKLVRKFDLRLLPILVSLYVMSFLDRVNIGKNQDPILHQLNLGG